MTPEKRLEHIEQLLQSLSATASYESPVPIPLRDAALVCNMPLRTLRQLIDRKEIPAYRHDSGCSWRVFPKDIKTYLMRESNQAPARRLRVLRSQS